MLEIIKDTFIVIGVLLQIVAYSWVIMALRRRHPRNTRRFRAAMRRLKAKAPALTAGPPSHRSPYTDPKYYWEDTPAGK